MVLLIMKSCVCKKHAGRNDKLNIAFQKTLLERHVMSADPPDIVFVEFFREKYLSAKDKYIMVIHAHPHWVQIKHTMRS